MRKSVCVIGAGLSGLAALRALRLEGHDVSCFEAGSALGGLWRYDNDNGVSAAYASLHTNVSRRNMQYPSFPFPGPPDERVHHSELLAYLEAYAEANGLLDAIAFGTRVRSARPQRGGGWLVETGEGESRSFEVLVVAAGQFAAPQTPKLAGAFEGEMLHVRDYRDPSRYEGRRVLVLGAGQSALDVAAEISFVAARTVLACRRSHHLIPARLAGQPLDRLDTAAVARVPWPVTRSAFHMLMALTGTRPDPGELPPPEFPLMEYRWPVLVTPNIERALAARTFSVAPGVARLEGEEIAFADGRQEPFDAIVFATGYTIDFPFLPGPLGRGEGQQFPLYRRILSPHAESLAFIGLVDAGPGRLQVVERQASWLAALLAGRLTPPTEAAMWAAIDAGNEPRSHRRFGGDGPHSTLCDRHAYLRVLDRDLGGRSWTAPRLSGPA